MVTTLASAATVRLLRTPEKNAGSANNSCQCTTVYGLATLKKPYSLISDPTTRRVNGAANVTMKYVTHRPAATQRQRPRRAGREAYSRPVTVAYDRPPSARRYSQVSRSSHTRKITAIAVASPTLDGWLLTRS